MFQVSRIPASENERKIDSLIKRMNEKGVMVLFKHSYDHVKGR